MAWIRLSDDYVDDEKMQALSDGAFRLWHEAMAYCRRHQTDGLIPFTVMSNLRSFTKHREKQLASPVRDGLAPLWELIPGTGYKFHNYLGWNPSKDEENERRSESKERMRVLRERRHTSGVPPNRLPRSRNVCANTNDCSREVLGQGEGKGVVREKGSGEKPTAHLVHPPSDDLAERAGDLLNRYRELYAKHRHGAKLRLLSNSVEFDEACSLVRLWDDARLDKLAAIVLTTDDPFIANTDRGFKIFTLKASWADERLSAWEAEQKRAV